jgi:hypothetical protein
MKARSGASMLTFNMILRHEGIDPEKVQVQLVRHQTSAGIALPLAHEFIAPLRRARE